MKNGLGMSDWSLGESLIGRIRCEELSRDSEDEEEASNVYLGSKINRI